MKYAILSLVIHIAAAYNLQAKPLDLHTTYTQDPGSRITQREAIILAARGTPVYKCNQLELSDRGTLRTIAKPRTKKQ